MGLSQTKDLPLSDMTTALLELQSKYTTRQLTGSECTEKLKQLSQQQGQQGKNVQQGDGESCRRLMGLYADKLKVIEKVQSALKYAERRFNALTKGPRCVNESADVTDTMDVPSADLTKEQCNRIRNSDPLKVYVWRDEIYIPDRTDELANKGWYDIIDRAMNDINVAYRRILSLIDSDSDSKNIDTLIDVIKTNADDAYIEAVKYVYTQYKVARAENVEQMSKGAEQTVGGGRRRRTKVKKIVKVKPCRALKKH